MAQSNSIAEKVDAVLVAAKWPQGRTPEQSQNDIQAVMNLMNSKLGGKAGGGAVTADGASGPGPHQ
jgi:uncharacterized protein YeaC (DUF1315 family)